LTVTPGGNALRSHVDWLKTFDSGFAGLIDVAVAIVRFRAFIVLKPFGVLNYPVAVIVL
jgi:hypothetical protein